MWRGDRRAARSLLGRAAALSDLPDVHLVVSLARSLDDTRAGAVLLDEAAARAETEGDTPGAALARAISAYLRGHVGEVTSDEQERLALAALPLLEAAEDDAGLCEIWSALAIGAYNIRCRYDQIEHASEQAIRHAELAGQQRAHLFMLPVALIFGPRPVEEALTKLEHFAAGRTHPAIGLDRANLLALGGRLDEARALAASARRSVSASSARPTRHKRSSPTSSGSPATTKPPPTISAATANTLRTTGSRRSSPRTRLSVAASSVRSGASTRPRGWPSRDNDSDTRTIR